MSTNEEVYVREQNWFQRNWYLLTGALLILLILIAWIFWPFGRMNKNMTATEKSYMEVSVSANDIYVEYILLGMDESMVRTPKPYKELQTVLADLTESIDNYRKNNELYSKEQLGELGVNIVMLAEKFEQLLNENPELEGYRVTEELRKQYSKQVSSLR